MPMRQLIWAERALLLMRDCLPSELQQHAELEAMKAMKKKAGSKSSRHLHNLQDVLELQYTI